MLTADVNLHICISKSVVVRGKLSAGIYRFSRRRQMIGDILRQLSRFLFLINFPAVI